MSQNIYILKLGNEYEEPETYGAFTDLQLLKEAILVLAASIQDDYKYFREDSTTPQEPLDNVFVDVMPLNVIPGSTKHEDGYIDIEPTTIMTYRLFPVGDSVRRNMPNTEFHYIRELYGYEVADLL